MEDRIERKYFKEYTKHLGNPTGKKGNMYVQKKT